MVKNVAIIGANKDALKLLPFLNEDKSTNIVAIIDLNPQAMLYKLKELGYKLDPELDIKEVNVLNNIHDITNIDIIVDTLEDYRSKKILDFPQFKATEKLGTLSAKLLWKVRTSNSTEQSSQSTQENLLTSLHDIVEAVKLTNDRRELLNVLLNLATESTRAERGSIMLIDKSDNTLRVETAKGIEEEVARKIQVPLGKGISGKVALSGKAMLISGKADSETFINLRERSDVKSALCVPLKTNNEIIGVINVNSSASTHAFTNVDLKYLTTLSGFAADVIQRSSEFEEMKIDASKFSFWKDIESIMGDQIKFEKKLIDLSRKLTKIIPSMTCYIYIYDKDRKTVHLKASSIKNTHGMGPMSIGFNDGIEGSVLQSLEPCVMVDRNTSGNIRRTHITIPMIAKDKTLIGLFVGHIISATGLNSYQENFINEMIPLIAEKIHELKIKEEETDYSQRMIAVDEMGLAIISIKDLKRAAEVSATAAAQILSAEAVSVRFRNHTHNFHLASSYGFELDDILKEHFLPLEKEAIQETLRKKDNVLRDFSEEASPHIRGIITCPIIVHGNVAGTLSVLNKVSMDSFYPSGFSSHDMEILNRLVSYLTKVLTNKEEEQRRTKTKEESIDNIIEPSGFHDTEPAMIPLNDFNKKTDDEISRSKRFNKKLVLASIKIGKADFAEKFIGFTKSKIRTFDTITMLDKTTVGILFPESDEKIIRVLETLIDAASLYDFSDDIFFGYSVYPTDGEDFESLLSKANANANVRYITPTAAPNEGKSTA